MTRLLLAALPLWVAACEAPTGGEVSRAAPNPQEQACLRDVTAAAGGAEVVLLGSDFSQAGTLVRVGVGPERAPWQCVAYADGTTDGIQSMAREGYL